MIYLNGQEVIPTVFPDHTSQVWKVRINPDTNVILWSFLHEAELIHLCQLIQLLDSQGAQFKLAVPYLPYARQDKDISNDATFALHTFRDILSGLSIPIKMYVFDAHPTNFDWSGNYLQIVNVSPVPAISQVIKHNEYDGVVFPDKSAAVRYAKIDFPQYVCEKERDQLTGHITKFVCDDIPSGHYLVVDDLCDGGATFNILADSLQDVSLDLCVSHGIFSKGFNQLLQRYQTIFCSNSLIFDVNVNTAMQQSAWWKDFSRLHDEGKIKVFDCIQEIHNNGCNFV